jgi:hypothetical protein
MWKRIFIAALLGASLLPMAPPAQAQRRGVVVGPHPAWRRGRFSHRGRWYSHRSFRRGRWVYW